MVNIPQYFIVKRSEDEYWNKYIMFLNKEYEENLSGDCAEYYGYDGSSTSTGVSWYNGLKYFQNNPAIFESAKDFFEHIELKNPKINEVW